MRLNSWNAYEPIEVTKSGMSIAKYFGEGSTLATGRDSHPVSRFVRRCIVNGLVTLGTQVLDFRVVPSQALRYGILKQKLDGAIYTSYFRGEIQLHVYDSMGRNLSAEGVLRIKDIEKTMEQKTAGISEIGSLIQYTNGIDDYVDYIASKAGALPSGKWLIDTQADPISLVVEPLFSRLGADFDIFNPALISDREIRPREEFLREFRDGRYHHGAIIERDELLGASYVGENGESRKFGSFEEMILNLCSTSRQSI